MTRYSDDHDGYCDMRADAEELRRSEIEWAHENPPEIGTRPAAYGMCTACGAVEVSLNASTGTRDLSGMGESSRYPTGYGCEVCS